MIKLSVFIFLQTTVYKIYTVSREPIRLPEIVWYVIKTWETRLRTIESLWPRPKLDPVRPVEHCQYLSGWKHSEAEETLHMIYNYQRIKYRCGLTFQEDQCHAFPRSLHFIKLSVHWYEVSCLDSNSNVLWELGPDPKLALSVILQLPLNNCLRVHITVYVFGVWWKRNSHFHVISVWFLFKGKTTWEI